MKRRKKRNYTKFDSFLELPQEVVSNESKISILGFNEMLIENYKNILEYQDILIKINTYKGTITIYGFSLKLEEMTNEDIKITGKIDTIEFEEIN